MRVQDIPMCLVGTIVALICTQFIVQFSIWRYNDKYPRKHDHHDD